MGPPLAPAHSPVGLRPRRFSLADTCRPPLSAQPRARARARAAAGFNGVCNYDGRLSLVAFRGRFFLFARSNTKTYGGGRYVQVARSLHADPAAGFGSFSPLSIEGYDSKGPGNIYLAAVKRAPGQLGMLLGLFSVNLGNATEAARRRASGRLPSFTAGNTDGRSFVGLALSCDGVHWSALEEVAPSVGREGRTYDQPVDGLLHIGDSVSVVIHRDVYEISPEASYAREPQRGKSRLVARPLHRAALDALARRVRSSLDGCAGQDVRTSSRTS